MRARLLHCMRVRLRNGYTRAYAQIMQHTHTHKAVTERVEGKKLLSRRRQSNYSVLEIHYTHAVKNQGMVFNRETINLKLISLLTPLLSSEKIATGAYFSIN